MRDLMTTHEVADYLRLKERKVYDLVATGEIPCTRVTGKILFPKQLIDIWLARSSTFPDITAAQATPPPPVIVGSHDPLLEWAVRGSECELALMPGGSLDGLQRFARGEAVACGMHVLDMIDGGYNVSAVSEANAGMDCVLIEWAWREPYADHIDQDGVICPCQVCAPRSPGGQPRAVSVPCEPSWCRYR